MEIKKANQEDLNDILRLQKVCYKTEAELHDEYDIPPLNQDLDSMLDDFNKMLILKGSIDGKIIGSVRGYKNGKTCYIGRLIVHNDYQNKGYGRMLMDAIEREFDGCDRYELFTGFKSQKNLYLYKKLGYKEFKQERLSEKITFIYLEKLNAKEK